MSELKLLWGRAPRGAKIGLAVGALVIVLVTAGIGKWALGKEYHALFTDLSEQDASVMVAELDRMKVPYRLESGGTRILVPQEMVHKTRLQLVGKNLPLHGAVGFEIFNDSDMGMTEFTQKVNYQRALQGELTRTIMALEEVHSARVHLAMAESTLFKRDQNRSKASVTLALKPGHSLERPQIIGIQRLVAAAVSGVEPDDVTVSDQKGVTLSRRTEGGPEGLSWQLEVKRQIEDHLVRKVAAVLDKAFGPGQGVVSVDVVLNFDHVKVTTEEVLGAKSAEPGGPATGVLIRERQTQRDRPGRDKGADADVSSIVTTDTDFQAGRRVEQIVGTPGSVKKINVGVVVPRGVSAERLERVKQVVSMAAGLDLQRGDGIAVSSLDQMSDGSPSLRPESVAPSGKADPPPDVQRTPARGGTSDDVRDAILAMLALAAALTAAWWIVRSRTQSREVPMTLQLSGEERRRLLANVQRWLDAPAQVDATRRPS